MRNLGLDLLRFLAILLVLGRHLNLTSHSNFFLNVWNCGGWVGVDLFFVLSGFLISSLLFKEYQRSGEINLKRFLFRRAFKIYPAFWVLILFYTSFLFFVNQPPSISQIAHELLFVQNYFPGFLGFSWSLAVEEHFYLSLAVLFSVLRKFKKNKMFDSIPIVFAVLSVGCLMLRIFYVGTADEFSFGKYSLYTHTRIDSLFFGVFISYLVHFKNFTQWLQNVPTLALIILGGLLLSPVFIFSNYTHRWVLIWGYLLTYLGSGLWVLAAVRTEKSQNHFLRGLGSLGAASYSIYLWHFPIRLWTEALIHKWVHSPSPYCFIIAYVLGAFLVGWIFNHLIERPILWLRETLFKAEISSTKLFSCLHSTCS
jgi:peptidoglycan/LPS O-acetylase OafA/YrhL